MHRFTCVHCEYESSEYLEAEKHAIENKRHAILDRLRDNIACVSTDD